MEKYEYLTGEDLGHKPGVFEKAKFECSPFSMSLNKAFKKDKVKSVAKSKSDFNYDCNHIFFEFYKSIHVFKNMSLGPKYTLMKNFNKRLIRSKNVKPIKSERRWKRSGLLKMLKKFAASIMMPTKTTMTMVVS